MKVQEVVFVKHFQDLKVLKVIFPKANMEIYFVKVQEVVVYEVFF